MPLARQPNHRPIVIAALALLFATIDASARPLRIVAVGASNTHGWYVSKDSAYPALLETLLTQKGIDAHVVNAGVPFDTTAMMLSRLNAAVPNGTDIVILQPGANDLRFFGTKKQRTANIDAIVQQLQARSIKVIVYDEVIPLRYYAFDFIHLTREGHAMIASALLPRILEEVNRRGARSSRPGTQSRMRD